MKNIEINKLNLKELKFLLKKIKTYKEFRNKLWNRWVELFKRNMNNKNLLVVEYFPSIDENLAKNIALKVYKKKFNLDVKENEIVFIKKEELKWWIKVYKNDFLVDLSFLKVEKKIVS